MTAEQFLDLVEQAGLLDPAELAAMREHVASATFQLDASEVAELLVQKELLTEKQAARILERTSDQAEKKGGGKMPERPVKRRPSLDAELGLAPLDGEADQEILDLVPDTPASKDSDDIVLLEAAEPAKPAKPAKPAAVTDADLGLTPLEPGPSLDFGSGRQPLSPLGGLEPLSGAGLTPLDPLSGLEPIPSSGPARRTGYSQAANGLQSLGALAQPPARAAATPAAVSLKKSPWDSMLLLAGGGGLLLLVAIGVALYFSVYRGSADELLKSADDDYKAQAYPQAIGKYETFLSQYPNDKNASLVRVKIGTARLWQLATGSGDKREALKAVGEVLPQIENETAFPDSQTELAAILPMIADGLSTQALAQQDPAKAQELVQASEEALKFINTPNYIPTALRKSIENKLSTIQENLDKAQRTINSTQQLTEALAAIQQAVAAGKTTEAYAIRRKLVRQYPELERKPALVEAVQAITAAERGLVKVEDVALVAQTQDHPRGNQLELALASRTGQGVAGSDTQVACLLARGSIWGLQANKGNLLWRRFVGHEATIFPVPVAGPASPDWLAVDERRHELLRLKATTGELVWRLPIGEPILSPVPNGKRLLLATPAGRILSVDATSGAVSRQATLPLKLAAPPTVSKSQQLYQVGEHSNLYVLDESSLACQEVYYVGHKPGSIVVPPVVALQHLFVAENSGETYCELHVLAADEKGLNLKPVKKSPLRLAGRVVSPPLVQGARVIVVTDLGGVHVFEVSPDNAEQPVLEAVEPLPASFKSPLIGYATIDNSRLWVGNDRLTKYEVQTLKSKMLAKWIKLERDTFVGPLQVFGDVLVSLRRRPNSPAYTATAVHVEDGQTQWQTDLAVPLNLLAADVARKQIHVINSQAELFEVTTELFQTGHLDQPAGSAVGASRTVPFTEALPVNGTQWALASAQDRSQLVIYDSQAVAAAGRLESRQLKSLGDAQLGGPLVPVAGGLLVPLDNGQLALMDVASGQSKASPFQSPTEAGTKVAWRRAAVVGAAGDEFLIADNRKQLFRIGVAKGTPPRLEQRGLNPLDAEFVAPLVGCGSDVCTVVRDRTSDKLVRFPAADVGAAQDLPLEGRVAWGPEALGTVVLLATDRQLICCEPGPKQRWAIPLTHGPLVGQPLQQENDALVAFVGGVVLRLALADGKEVGKAELGEPLSTGAVPFGTRLLLGGSDGTLYAIPALTRQ